MEYSILFLTVSLIDITQKHVVQLDLQVPPARVAKERKQKKEA